MQTIKAQVLAVVMIKVIVLKEIEILKKSINWFALKIKINVVIIMKIINKAQ